MPEGISPADRKMGKVVTGLQSRAVTAHEIINIILKKKELPIYNRTDRICSAL